MGNPPQARDCCGKTGPIKPKFQSRRQTSQIPYPFDQSAPALQTGQTIPVRWYTQSVGKNTGWPTLHKCAQLRSPRQRKPWPGKNRLPTGNNRLYLSQTT